MRRIVMVAALVGLLVALFAAAALAVNKQCSNYPCWGTNARDTLYERGGNGVPDYIIGRRYGDLINANAFITDRDVLDGQRGNDRLRAQDGDGRDELYGGPGYDICYINEGDFTRGCEEVALVFGIV
jgi:hypothetical protein